MPHAADCGHVYCYVCLQQLLVVQERKISTGGDVGNGGNGGYGGGDSSNSGLYSGSDPQFQPICRSCFQPMSKCIPIR